MQSDISQFTQNYLQQHDPHSEVPKFLLGNSLGGTISSFISSFDKSYKGTCYAVPFFGHYDDKWLKKIAPMLPALHATTPDKLFPLQKEKMKHKLEWSQDVLYTGNQISAQNVIAQNEGFELLEQARIFEGIENPTLLLMTGKDTVVDNKKSKEFYESIKSKSKQMITYDEIDHGIFIDGEYMPLVVKDIVDWMDVHL